MSEMGVRQCRGSMGPADLSAARVVSSIPRAADAPVAAPACPHAGAAARADTSGTCAGAGAGDARHANWVYPSEQMFYDAMARKGTLSFGPDAGSPKADMAWVVAIHNIVNEQAWQHICRWEGLRGGGQGQGLALVRFLGRPEALSPRAWLRTNLLGCQRPFDRHDWYVQRPDGSVHRYVIDFYGGRGGASVAGGFYLDVRPALDSAEALQLRWRRFCLDCRERVIKFAARG